MFFNSGQYAHNGIIALDRVFFAFPLQFNILKNGHASPYSGGV